MDNLDKAPIIEAQFGIRFGTPLGVYKITQLVDRLRTDFEKVSPRYQYQTLIKMSEEAAPPAKTSSELDGYQLTNATGEFVIIIQRTQFIVCRLKKYPGWEVFRTQSQVFLDKVEEIILDCNPMDVFTRYINSIKLQYPLELGNHFSFLPVMGDLEGQVTIFNLAYNYGISKRDSNLMANISFFPRPLPKDNNEVEFVLDLSVSRQGKVETYKQLWDNLESTRPFKNEVFKTIVSKNLMERFK